MIYTDVFLFLVGEVIGLKRFVLSFGSAYQFAFFVIYCRKGLRSCKRSLYACEIINIKHIRKPRRTFFKFGKPYIMLFSEFIVYKVVTGALKICRYVAHRSFKSYRSAVLGIYRLAGQEEPVIIFSHHKPTMSLKCLFLLKRNIGEHLGYRRYVIGMYNFKQGRICLLILFSGIYSKRKIS